MTDDQNVEVDLMRAVVLHYANLVHLERSRADRLQRQLECAQARLEMFEDTAYGRSFL